MRGRERRVKLAELFSLWLAGQTGRVRRFSDKQLVQTMAELIVALRAIVESYKSYLHNVVSVYVCKPPFGLSLDTAYKHIHTREYRRFIVLNVHSGHFVGS